MTDHFREAERLVARAHHFTYGDGADPVTGAALAAEAQVHATLATVPARDGVDLDQLNELVAELAKAQKQIAELEERSSRLATVEYMVERGHNKGYTPDIEELAEALGLTKDGADRG
ncbi:hypothetical protein [Streptomyces sp. NPDC019937]|uniref:hypothetical protein n=1 Tax=Streptomyces sp. NPDC019937 TaxID=3154787 RepID=UPI0033F97005